MRLRAANGAIIAPYDLAGPFLRIGTTEAYLPSPAQWLALQAVARHQAFSHEERSEYRNLFAIHQLQKASQAGCDIDLRHFSTLHTVAPDGVAVAVEVLSSGDNRDREASHDFPPPTPPGIRVRTMAVRYG